MSKSSPEPFRVERETRAALGALQPGAGRPIDFVRLAGEASNRRYFRAHLGGAGSVIVMELPAAGSVTRSEELTEAEAIIRELPFVNVQRLLEAIGVPVPRILHYDPDAGFLLLEDLGDELLEKRAKWAVPAERMRWYEQAIGLLLRMQVEGTKRLDSSCVAFHRAFTEHLLMLEFEHFVEYGLGTKLGTRVPQARLGQLRGAFAQIAARLAAIPRVFTHRDFQSRNLLVAGDRLVIIDFQDALLGPPVYDLVALLRDSYLELTQEEVESLIRYYTDRAKQPLKEFRGVFDRMTVQRKLKDFGRFIYIDRVKGNPKYLVHNPTNARYVLEALERLPEGKTLLPLLLPDLERAVSRRT